MYKLRSRGFTLIELLVVIAIIGILSAVVLASLSTARTKGQDAAIQSDLNSIQTEAEIYYNGTGANTYGSTVATCTGGMFAGDTSIKNALTGIASNNGGSGNQACDSSGQAYAVKAKSATNSSSVFYCVDSTGFSGTTTTMTAATNC
ncbi:MAG TPA: type II secretion system protein [Candidatus Paceibacterota bacterium]|nr:type II secretion system protein [Candidatus Paceibacterota bacterium]